MYHQERPSWNCDGARQISLLTASDGNARGDTKLKACASTFVQSRVTLYLEPLPLQTTAEQRALDCVCFGQTSGTAPAAMGGSRRPRSDQHFITVRDGELQNAQSALKALAKDVTLLHSTYAQTMLFPGCLWAGCQDFNLLGLYGPDNIGARSSTFWRGSEVSPGFLQLLERSLGLSSLSAKQSSLALTSKEWTRCSRPDADCAWNDMLL